jgi:hypothetical protein
MASFASALTDPPHAFLGAKSLPISAMCYGQPESDGYCYGESIEVISSQNLPVLSACKPLRVHLSQLPVSAYFTIFAKKNGVMTQVSKKTITSPTSDIAISPSRSGMITLNASYDNAQGKGFVAYSAQVRLFCPTIKK